MHFCTLNWSPWSKVLLTDDNLLIQTRLCKVCRRMNTRKAPNLNGLNVDEINAALDSVSEIIHE